MFTSLILLSTLARADLVVPGQERCDGQKQCGKLEIVSCQSGYHGEPTPDCDPYKGAGYRFACDSGGATVSTAYYCKLEVAPAPSIPEVTPTPAVTEPAKPAPTAEPAKCSTSPEGGFAGLGVALLVLAWRRR